jgi:hypothetical protein
LSCPICLRRPEKRFCPAKGERICAVCCGTEREVTIDCPADCEHLVAARRWEAEHRKPLPPAEVPYPDTRFPAELVHRHRPLVSGLGLTLLHYAHETRDVVDADALAAFAALAEALRTLAAGIYFERPPEAGHARALYDRLAAFLREARERQAQEPGLAALGDTDAFHLAVFLLRIARMETNGRPRSRAFLDFLRRQYPPDALAPGAGAADAPRIITP